MKTCQLCATSSDDAAETCTSCGEASFVPDEQPAADAETGEAQEQTPKRARRK